MRVLILVDIQNDFLPGGALAVNHGDEVIAVANALQPHFDHVVSTQDWHPPNHGSFAANHEGRNPGELIDLHGLQQVLWPVHCVQESRGAEFADTLDTSRVAKVFVKGTDPQIDSYSGFFDNGKRKATGLGAYLKDLPATSVYVMGLATDYCVKFTALDAHELGFATFLVRDGCRAVNLAAGDDERAIAEMTRAGIKVVTSQEILQTAT